MDKEVRIVKFNNSVTGAGEDERVMEWEDGLPGLDDLTPLSQALIPPELASAFKITAEPPRTLVDVNRESKNTIASLRSHNYINNNNNFKSFEGEEENPIVLGNEDMDLSLGGLVSKKMFRNNSIVEETDSVSKNENNNDYSDNVDTSMMSGNDDIGSVKSLKRPRLVWTPQLHKRFVDVVAHLGIKNAVPKTIMTLMNVEGLTRENVASHLQKYRLYLKRMRGLSDEGPSASDHLFASTPVPRSLQEGSGGNEAGHGNGNGHQGQDRSNGNGHFGMHIPMSYPPPPPPPQMMHMSYIGMAANGHGHLGMPPGNGYHGYEARQQYNMLHTSFPQYHNHVTPNDN